MKTLTSIAFLSVLLLMTGATAAAQTVVSAEQAVIAWKTKAIKEPADPNALSYRAVGVSVERYLDDGLTIKFAVAVGREVASTHPLWFEVQPTATVLSAGGSSQVPVGKPSKLGGSVFQREAGDVREFISGAKLTIPITGDVDSISVRVKGLGADPQQVFSMTIPVGREIGTAVIGTTAAF